MSMTGNDWFSHLSTNIIHKTANSLNYNTHTVYILNKWNIIDINIIIIAIYVRIKYIWFHLKDISLCLPPVLLATGPLDHLNKHQDTTMNISPSYPPLPVKKFCDALHDARAKKKTKRVATKVIHAKTICSKNCPQWFLQFILTKTNCQCSKLSYKKVAIHPHSPACLLLQKSTLIQYIYKYIYITI